LKIDYERKVELNKILEERAKKLENENKIQTKFEEKIIKLEKCEEINNQRKFLEESTKIWRNWKKKIRKFLESSRV
jgi:hypothetical protein